MTPLFRETEKRPDSFAAFRRQTKIPTGVLAAGMPTKDGKRR